MNSVDETLQQAADVATKHVDAKREEIRGLQAAGAEERLVVSAKRELEPLVAAQREAQKAIEKAAAELQQQRVSKCATALEARIAPFVAAVLAGRGVAARASFEAEMVTERERLKK